MDLETHPGVLWTPSPWGAGADVDLGLCSLWPFLPDALLTIEEARASLRRAHGNHSDQVISSGLVPGQCL